VPEQLREHALTEADVQITDEALRVAIEEYTREAGVRNLEREVANLCRKAAVEVARGQGSGIRDQGSGVGDQRSGRQGDKETKRQGDKETEERQRTTDNGQRTITINAEKAREYLGKRRYFAEVTERIDRPGIVTGLVWTPVGGDILFIEATAMPGGKGFVLTGQLGDVMKESARAALSWVRAEADHLGIDSAFYDTHDIHMHVPAGAIPKDGPSAGIAMTTALTSLLTGRALKEGVAMTGEITLRGKVLPIGGVKEKVLAAHRAGIRRVILPKRNESDLDDIPEEVLCELTFVLVERMEEVLDAALQPAQTEPPIAATDGQAPHPSERDNGNRIENTHESVETIPEEYEEPRTKN
jgi:ATP-dependent Lon protease